MSVEKIPNFEELLQPFLAENQTISSYKGSRLTAPGENYGSLMLAVEVLLAKEGQEETLNLIAKLIPPNKLIQKYFNSQTTFRNEIAFYNIIAPTLKQFQKEEGMKEFDFIPVYYGSRLSLNPNSESVDTDAVLLLENLKIRGYANIDRMVGFDLPAAKKVLKDLATFHAVSLGLKLKDPKIFIEKIRPHLRELKITQTADEKMRKKFVDRSIKIIGEDAECVPYLERVREVLEDLPYDKPIREPFATMIHSDFWTDNIMLRFVFQNPIGSKMVDFQICKYGSVAQDLIFFLYSSVQTEVLQKQYDALVKFYHKHFFDVLEELKCDSTFYTLHALLEDIRIEAKETQFTHIIEMLYPIFTSERAVKPIEELTEDDFGANYGDVIDLMKAKASFVVKDFAKRNWI